MPAKRKQQPEEAVAKAAAKKAAKVADKIKDTVAENSPSTCAVNARLQGFLAECDAKIKDHFKDLMSMPTSSYDDSGIATYDKVTATRLLSAGSSYTCSAPLYWLNTGFELQPNVPRYRKRIMNLKDHFFSSPTPMLEPTVVRLSPGELPHKMQGSLKAVDLPELRDALRVAVAEAIENGNTSKKDLASWKEVLLSIPFRFEAMGLECLR
jgi:hypothetical protein